LDYELTPVAAMGADVSAAGKPAAPGTDGGTVTIPAALSHQMDTEDYAWLIPGLRTGVTTALLRALPEPIRTTSVPAPATAQAAATYLAEHANPKTDNFFDELGAFLRQVKHQYLKPDDWTVDKLPPHLRFSYQVSDERGAIAGASDDLAKLQRELAG